MRSCRSAEIARRVHEAPNSPLVTRQNGWERIRHPIMEVADSLIIAARGRWHGGYSKRIPSVYRMGALSVRRTIMRHGWIMIRIETVFFIAGIALLIGGGCWLTSAR
jgi:hypothetical protein